jgi:hypothetical protein
VLADAVASKFSFFNSIFTSNYAVLGGVAYAQALSSVSFLLCNFLENFALIGGVMHVGTDGLSHFEKSIFTRNSAYQGSILFMINSLYQNELTELTLDDNRLVYDE